MVHCSLRRPNKNAAGIMALADQFAGAAHRFGNPLLYSLAVRSAFTDIVDPASTVAALRTNSPTTTRRMRGSSTYCGR